MMDSRPIRIPVYLTRRTVRDMTGTAISIRERCLVPQGRDDRVIATILAPAGSRVRRRLTQHGHDQLVVPLGRTFLSRLFGHRVSIPAKYVISDARGRSYGLTLLTRETESDSTDPAPPAERSLEVAI